MVTPSSVVSMVVIGLVMSTPPASGLQTPVQQDSISGVVVDARSRPLFGARVLVAGIERATSDAAGRFRLLTLRGGEVTLEVTLIGYRPLTQTVRVGQTGLRLVLTEAAVRLDEIVVTGTGVGTQRRAVGNK